MPLRLDSFIIPEADIQPLETVQPLTVEPFVVPTDFVAPTNFTDLQGNYTIDGTPAEDIFDIETPGTEEKDWVENAQDYADQAELLYNTVNEWRYTSSEALSRLRTRLQEIRVGYINEIRDQNIPLLQLRDRQKPENLGSVDIQRVEVPGVFATGKNSVQITKIRVPWNQTFEIDIEAFANASLWITDAVGATMFALNPDGNWETFFEYDLAGSTGTGASSNSQNRTIKIENGFAGDYIFLAITENASKSTGSSTIEVNGQITRKKGSFSSPEEGFGDVESRELFSLPPSSLLFGGLALGTIAVVRNNGNEGR